MALPGLIEKLRGFKVEFRYKKVPILLGCEKELDSNTAVATTVHTVMATTVPRGMPGIAVVPEKLHHTLFLKPLGIVQDMHVGDERFDREFMVQVVEEQDLEIIDEKVRLGMLALKERESPQLLLEKGVASIHWYSEPQRPAILAAMDVLLALRANRPTL